LSIKYSFLIRGSGFYRALQSARNPCYTCPSP